jgi:hypothetical protein
MAESSEFVKLLVGDYGPIVGPHPLDDFYAGDPSGTLPICNALK